MYGIISGDDFLDFYKVTEFRLSWRLTIILNIIAGAIFAFGYFFFLYYYIPSSDEIVSEGILDNSNIWITYIAVLIQAALHEYSHGIGYRLSGGKPKYGIKWLCPYCMEKTGILYSTKDFIITLMLPIITGTIAGLLILIIFPQFLYYIIVCMLTNLSGAAGDIMMVFFILLKTNRTEFVKDEPYGFSVHRRIRENILV